MIPTRQTLLLIIKFTKRQNFWSFLIFDIVEKEKKKSIVPRKKKKEVTCVSFRVICTNPSPPLSLSLSLHSFVFVHFFRIQKRKTWLCSLYCKTALTAAFYFQS